MGMPKGRNGKRNTMPARRRHEYCPSIPSVTCYSTTWRVNRKTLQTMAHRKPLRAINTTCLAHVQCPRVYVCKGSFGGNGLLVCALKNCRDPRRLRYRRDSMTRDVVQRTAPTPDSTTTTMEVPIYIESAVFRHDARANDVHPMRCRTPGNMKHDTTKTTKLLQ